MYTHLHSSVKALLAKTRISLEFQKPKGNRQFKLKYNAKLAIKKENYLKTRSEETASYFPSNFIKRKWNRVICNAKKVKQIYKKNQVLKGRNRMLENIYFFFFFSPHNQNSETICNKSFVRLLFWLVIPKLPANPKST